MKRKKLVVWSGGMDSTFLLTDIADEFSSSKSSVLAYSFDIDFLDVNKRVMERRARSNYLKRAKKKGYNIENKEIKISFLFDVSSSGWAQGLFWFSFIVPFIPDDCDVYFGYVQGDGIWMAVSSFHNAYESLSYVGDRQATKLHYPFAYKKKWEIIKGIQDS